MKLLLINGASQIERGIVQRLKSLSSGFDLLLGGWCPGDKNEQVVELISRSKVDCVICSLVEDELTVKDQSSYFKLLKAVAEQCASEQSVLIYIGDYQVFDGIKNTPYIESDPVAPLNDYGRWQVSIEQALQDQLSDLLIIRTGWRYSQWSDNYLHRLLKKASQEDVLLYDPSIQSNPSAASDIARVLIAMIQQLSCGAPGRGVFHYCSAGLASGYQFSEAAIAVASQYDPLLSEDKLELVEKACYHSDELSLAPVVMSCEKILNSFGIKQQPWRSHLADVVREYYM